jgi:hypothetical protein
MANRDFKDVQSYTREMKVLAGVVRLTGAASAANTVIAVLKGGLGIESVVRTGTGEFEVTLRDAFPGVESIQVTYEPHAGQARNAVITAGSVAAVQGTKKFKFTVVNASFAAADVANTQIDHVHIALFFTNSSVR